MEVKHLRAEFATRQLPRKMVQVFRKFDEFRANKNSLDRTVEMYNYVKRRTVREEFALIEKEVQQCDLELRPAETTINWNSGEVLNWTQQFYLPIFAGGAGVSRAAVQADGRPGEPGRPQSAQHQESPRRNVALGGGTAFQVLSAIVFCKITKATDHLSLQNFLFCFCVFGLFCVCPIQIVVITK